MNSSAATDFEDDVIPLAAATLAAIEDDVRRLAGPPLHQLDVAQAREGLDQRRRARPVFNDTRIRIGEEFVQGRAGAILSRTYYPVTNSDEHNGRIIYCHGGGWVMGAPGDFDAVCSRIALTSGNVVISPEYRLAPEWPYPAGRDDLLAVIERTASRGPFVVVGESAGANLSVAAVLELRQRSGPHPAGLALFYPVLDTAPPPLEQDAALDTPFLSAADVDWCWRHYLGLDGGAASAAMPARSGDLAGLPPLLVIHGTADPTMPATRRFVARARSAGNVVEERRFRGLPHAFTGLLHHEEIERIVDQTARWLAQVLDGRRDGMRDPLSDQ